MLYVEFKNGSYTGWHIGTPIDVYDVCAVVEVQADSDELTFIRDHITGIPDAKGMSVVTWYGDHARFIACALNTLTKRSHENRR